ncbi:hypothetical protein HPB49_011915 [Dermacentor silvarum]|uniref:Uncharacterized protein n=1 Tax=Dermacentor silvarum TaxID=543639 RepID=A0ACB8D4W0_DERSI|nr:hypothetical protein HPB49_011915 [Dermacentor silvarum]
MASSQESVPDLCGSEIERFLDAVQRHPCVYDTKRMDYRDAERKKNAWEQIRVYSDLLIEPRLPNLLNQQKVPSRGNWSSLKERPVPSFDDGSAFLIDATTCPKLLAEPGLPVGTSRRSPLVATGVRSRSEPVPSFDDGSVFPIDATMCPKLLELWLAFHRSKKHPPPGDQNAERIFKAPACPRQAVIEDLLSYHPASSQGRAASVSIANGKGAVRIAEHLRSQRHVHMNTRHEDTEAYKHLQLSNPEFKALHFKDPCHLLNNALEDGIRTTSFYVVHDFLVHFPAMLKSSRELRRLVARAEPDCKSAGFSVEKIRCPSIPRHVSRIAFRRSAGSSEAPETTMYV